MAQEFKNLVFVDWNRLASSSYSSSPGEKSKRSSRVAAEYFLFFDKRALPLHKPFLVNEDAISSETYER